MRRARVVERARASLARASRSTAPADARVARGASPRAAPAPRERERSSTARRDDSSSDARDAYSASLRARAEAAKRVGRTRGEASSERVAMTMGADGTAPRFYESVATRESETRDGTWRVTLDGRTLRTPRRNEYAFATEALARAIASEWEAQGERVAPFTMPLTSLSATAIDHMGDAETRRVHVETLLKHFGTDASAGAEPGRGDGGEAERGRTIDDRGVGGRESSGRRRRRIRSSGPGDEREDGGGAAAAVARDVRVGADVRVRAERGDEVVVDRFEGAARRADGGRSHRGGARGGGGADRGVGVSRGRARSRSVGYSRQGRRAGRADEAEARPGEGTERRG